MYSIRPNIILTGFMGTGKSTVGRILAGALDYNFEDSDQIIEARAGMTIPEIFQQKGEEAFRRMESEVAMELALRQGQVIATGGRLMLDGANAATLGGSGMVFCLKATPEEILSRVAADDNDRPLLDVPDPMARIVELLEERKAGYARFRQIETTGKTPKELAAEILKLIRHEYEYNL